MELEEGGGGMGREERKANKYGKRLAPHESDQSENLNDKGNQRTFNNRDI